MKHLAHIALVSLLPCAALAQSHAQPQVVQSPSGGWTYKGLSDDAAKITYAYPNNLIDRGGQQHRTLIEGHLKQAGKARGTPVLVANGNPMPLYTDGQGRFARPYAFGPGSNGIEVRDSEGRSIKRVQFYEANKLAAKAGVRIILAWDDPQAARHHP